MSNIYKEHGYNSREEYFESLAEEHGIPYEAVRSFSDILGENEDFDGLVTACEDAAKIDY